MEVHEYVMVAGQGVERARLLRIEVAPGDVSRAGRGSLDRAGVTISVDGQVWDESTEAFLVALGGQRTDLHDAIDHVMVALGAVEEADLEALIGYFALSRDERIRFVSDALSDRDVVPPFWQQVAFTHDRHGAVTHRWRNYRGSMKYREGFFRATRKRSDRRSSNDALIYRPKPVRPTAFSMAGGR